MKVVSAWTMVMPVVFVLFVSFVRELLEEIGRRKADVKTNNQKYNICNSISGQMFKSIQSKDIKQGDFIKLQNNDEVPCDILLLQSSDSSHICYVNTAQLDGEANLKQKSQFLEKQLSEQEICYLNGQIQTDMPSESMTFNGMIQLQQLNDITSDQLIKHSKFDMSNILLRGMKIQNTDYCYGIVIYTAKDSRILQAAGKAKNKFSKLEQRLRKILLWSCFFILLLCVIYTGVSYSYYQKRNQQSDSIVYQNEEPSRTMMVLNRFCSYLIIISYYAPISLIVSLDVTRYVQAFFISADKNLRIKELKADLSKPENKHLLKQQKIQNLASQQKYAQVRNSMAMETLPEVNFIFSDKTGTMTKNKMNLKVTVNNQLQQSDKLDDEQLLESLAVCNTVFPRLVNGKSQYQSESPDEVAFVQAAKDNGFVMESRMKDTIQYTYKDQKIEYKILAIIPFNSDRKRMSIIAQNLQTNQTEIFCKGAEIKILQILNCNQEQQESYHKIVDQVASQGLRTLMFSKRILSQDEIIYVENVYPEIKGLQTDHLSYVQFAEKLERNLDFVGITGVEDELQDNLKGTFNLLRDAGISIFMLTGDQKETALAIAKTSSLIDDTLTMIDLTSQNLKTVSQPTQTGVATDLLPLLSNATSIQSNLVPNKELYLGTLNNRTIHRKKNQTLQKSKTYLVIDSQVLQLILPTINQKHNQSYNPYTQYFIQLVLHATSIICCRLTPDQKARIVKLIQQYQKDITTLAIGDGCNDIFMLKQADVSIGIAGLEGLSAANSADISVVDFQSLGRLLTIHGRYTHLRNQVLIDYSLWKNGLIVFPTLIYQQYCNYTAQMAVEGILLMMFNTLITMISMMVFCFVEKDVQEQNLVHSSSALKHFESKKWSNYWTAIGDILYAIYNCFIIVYLTRAILTTQHISDEGYEADVYTFQSFNMTLAAFAGIIIVGQISRYWAYAVPIFMLISVLVLLLTLLYGAITNSMGIGELGTFQNMYTNGSFTIYCCTGIILCLLPLFVFQMAKYFLKPSVKDLLNMKEQSIEFFILIQQQQKLDIILEKNYLYHLLNQIFKEIEERIQNCEQNNLQVEGIYRIQGNQIIIKDTLDLIKQLIVIDIKQYKLHDIANIVKQILQNELQQEFHQEYINRVDLNTIKILYYQMQQKLLSQEQFNMLLTQLLNKQKEIDIKILKLISQHIDQLEKLQNKTKMNRNNLLLMFQVCILGNQSSQDIAAELDIKLFDQIMQIVKQLQ